MVWTFAIVERIGPLTYHLYTDHTRYITQSFHVERLKFSPALRPQIDMDTNQN